MGDQDCVRVCVYVVYLSLCRSTHKGRCVCLCVHMCVQFIHWVSFLVASPFPPPLFFKQSPSLNLEPDSAAKPNGRKSIRTHSTAPVCLVVCCLVSWVFSKNSRKLNSDPQVIIAGTWLTELSSRPPGTNFHVQLRFWWSLVCGNSK